MSRLATQTTSACQAIPTSTLIVLIRVSRSLSSTPGACSATCTTCVYGPSHTPHPKPITCRGCRRCTGSTTRHCTCSAALCTRESSSESSFGSSSTRLTRRSGLTMGQRILTKCHGETTLPPCDREDVVEQERTSG